MERHSEISENYTNLIFLKNLLFSYRAAQGAPKRHGTPSLTAPRTTFWGLPIKKSKLNFAQKCSWVNLLFLIGEPQKNMPVTEGGRQDCWGPETALPYKKKANGKKESNVGEL